MHSDLSCFDVIVGTMMYYQICDKYLPIFRREGQAVETTTILDAELPEDDDVLDPTVTAETADEAEETEDDDEDDDEEDDEDDDDDEEEDDDEEGDDDDGGEGEGDGEGEKAREALATDQDKMEMVFSENTSEMNKNHRQWVHQQVTDKFLSKLIKSLSMYFGRYSVIVTMDTWNMNTIAVQFLEGHNSPDSQVMYVQNKLRSRSGELSIQPEEDAKEWLSFERKEPDVYMTVFHTSKLCLITGVSVANMPERDGTAMIRNSMKLVHSGLNVSWGRDQLCVPRVALDNWQGYKKLVRDKRGTPATTPRETLVYIEGLKQKLGDLQSRVTRVSSSVPAGRYPDSFNTTAHITGVIMRPCLASEVTLFPFDTACKTDNLLELVVPGCDIMIRNSAYGNSAIEKHIIRTQAKSALRQEHNAATAATAARKFLFF